MIDFKDHLRNQLSFITNSCTAIDRGELAEGVRVATAIRVTVHQTPVSTSLLTHLCQPNVILLSTGRLSPTVVWGESGLTRMVLSSDGRTRIEASLGTVPGHQIVPLDTWWNEVILVFGDHRVRRRDLVLAAANKDGGAHVDSAVPESYKQIKDGLWTASPSGEKLTEQAAMTLRQLGYEVLNSPDLIKLTV